MKRIVVGALALCAVLPIGAQAQSNVTIYGRIDLGIDWTGSNKNRTSGVAMRDNTSRFGFKGGEDLGSGYKALFGAEWGFSADEFDPKATTADKAAINQVRNTYVGLSGGFGAFAMGRLDSSNPTKSPIYSLLTSNVSFVAHDAGAPAIGTKVLNARNRTSNSIGYITPTFGGATLMGRYSFNADMAKLPAGQSEGDFRQADLGLDYKNGPLGLGVGYSFDRKTDGLVANDFKDKVVGFASYDFGLLRLSGAYGRDSYVETLTSREDVDYWLVGVTAPVGPGKFVMNYMERDVQKDLNGVLKKFQFGYDYQLSKRTKLFALYDNEDPNSNVSDDSVKTVSVGIQHNF